jgi:hypothetical protein
MHPLTAYHLGGLRVSDLRAEADRDRLVRAARPRRPRADGDEVLPVRWALRRLFAKLHLSGSGA